MVVVLAFFDQKKAQLPAIRITKQPMLLTKSKTNCPGYKFSKYFRYKQAVTVKSRTHSHPRPTVDSKGKKDLLPSLHFSSIPRVFYKI